MPVTASSSLRSWKPSGQSCADEIWDMVAHADDRRPQVAVAAVVAAIVPRFARFRAVRAGLPDVSPRSSLRLSRRRSALRSFRSPRGSRRSSRRSSRGGRTYGLFGNFSLGRGDKRFHSGHLVMRLDRTLAVAATATPLTSLAVIARGTVRAAVAGRGFITPRAPLRAGSRP